MSKPPLTFANVTAEKPKARGILMKHKEKAVQSIYSKMGAPKKAIEEIRWEKLVANVTSAEKANFMKQAGLIGQSTFLRHVLEKHWYLNAE